MARTPKRMAGPAQLSGSAATKYTSPATGAIVREIHVSNPSGSAVTFTLSVGTDAAGVRLYDALSIPANSVRTFYHYIVLGNAEIIQAFAGTASTLTLTIDGDELS